MYENNNKKELWLIGTIIVIVVVVLFIFYFYFFKNIEKHSGIVKNDNNAEIVDNQNNSLKDDEIDIKEIERRLDDLDINLDDVLNQL